MNIYVTDMLRRKFKRASLQTEDKFVYCILEFSITPSCNVM